jgi:hypothetical protein
MSQRAAARQIWLIRRFVARDRIELWDWILETFTAFSGYKKSTHCALGIGVALQASLLQGPLLRSQELTGEDVSRVCPSLGGANAPCACAFE